MLKLPSVTLFCADCVNAERAVAAIEKCKAVCEFGAVKFLTSLPTTCEHRISIPHLPSLVDYSIFMLVRAPQYVDTKHVLVIQHDGYIINPGSWEDGWLNYDYIGPQFIQDHVENHHKVGSGGFSLRSKALMEFARQRAPAWDGSPQSTALAQTQVGLYEDGFICHRLYRDIMQAGMRIAPLAEARKFAQGGWPQLASPKRNDRTHYVERPFGFHGLWTNIDETGFVSPPPFVART